MNFKVNVSNSHIGEALQKMAFEAGFSWHAHGKVVKFTGIDFHYNVLYFDFDAMNIFTSSVGNYVLVSVEKAIELLGKEYCVFILDNISGHVNYTERTVTMDGKTFSFETAKKLYELIDKQ